MKKRTPQELADIFQGYVFRNCGSASWIVTPDKPKIAIGEWQWDHDSTLWFLIPVSAIKTDPDHDWRHLYEPHPDNKSETNYQNQPEVDNKAPHQSEVYIGERYVFLIAYGAKELASKVERYLADGYSLYGAPGVKSGGLAANIYFQAMVRG